MLNMIIKYLKYLGVIVGAIGLSIIGFIAYLLFCSWLDKRKLEYLPLEDIPSFCVLDVNTLREVTGNRDFPDFEAKQLWFYKSDISHSVPHIECRFKKKMSEEDFEKFFQVESNIYWNPDKDGTLWFSRGWSQKEYMDIPKGMEENLFISIDWLSRSGFVLSFMKNDEWVSIDKDYLNKLTGCVFPEYSVINFENGGKSISAKLLFSKYVEKNTADIFANGTDEIKVDTVIDNKRIFFDMLRDERYGDLFISQEE